MSINKSKLKKIIIVIIIAVLIVATTICIFLVVKKNKKNKNNSQPPENVNNESSIEAQINADIINQNICADYQGNYIFDSIMEIQFDSDLSISEKNKIYKSLSNNQAKDGNTFHSYLLTQNNYYISKEIITLVNGKYTKSIGSTKSETGLFFGNKDKSIIFTLDNEGTTIIDERAYSAKFEISLTGYWLPNIVSNSNDTIYIREKINYSNIGEKYLYITYAYKTTNICPNCNSANYSSDKKCSICNYLTN